jgi:hypothetical protein
MSSLTPMFLISSLLSLMIPLGGLGVGCLYSQLSRRMLMVNIGFAAQLGLIILRMILQPIWMQHIFHDGQLSNAANQMNLFSWAFQLLGLAAWGVVFGGLAMVFSDLRLRLMYAPTLPKNLADTPRSNPPFYGAPPPPA